MKAALARRYGSPDVVEIEEIEKPTPADDEVLVRVRAAAGNPMDTYFMHGVYIMRPFFGMRVPKKPRLGVDLAGEVEAVGSNVTSLKPGDKVYGVARGAFADYVCAKEKQLGLKPENASFEQAAAIPIAGITALQGIRDKCQLEPEQKILINGAAGGVGSFAVQIAKNLRAHVTGVCSTKSVDLVRSLGADNVIDYTREDFTKRSERYDVLFDCVGNRSLSDCRRVMTPKGIFVGVGARPGGRVIGPLPHILSLLILRPFVSQKVILHMAKATQEDLAVMKELVESGKVTPVIDHSYPFSDVAQVFRYLKEGHTRGKVVITVP